MHIGPWTLQQGQAAGSHRSRGAGEGAEAKRHGLAIMQRGSIGRRQPGLLEQPAQPALRCFDQALFGHFLNRGVQRQCQLMGRDITRDQLEYDVAAVLTTLADQHPVIAILPTDGQANGHPQIGQLGGETFGVRHVDLAPPLQGLREVHRHADALVAQAFRSGLDKQRQGLEVAGILPDQCSRHNGSFLRWGRPP